MFDAELKDKMQKEAEQSWFFFSQNLEKSDNEIKDYKSGYIQGYIQALKSQGYKNIPF